jgi:protein-S-isoprenylcysteine O-methyltransferase Ste14
MILPPTLFLLCVVAMALLHWLAPLRVVVPLPVALAGLLPLGAGIAAAVWGSRRFEVAGTQIRTFDTPTRLVTDGLFRLTRNPMYLGFVTALVGLWALFGSLSPGLAVLAFAGVAHRVYIPFEERALRGRFGAEYEVYRDATPRWL